MVFLWNKTRRKGIVDKEGNITATIVDAELDGIECEFDNAGCVILNTEGYSYITLSVENLLMLVELIAKAEKKYEKIFEKLEKEGKI